MQKQRQTYIQVDVHSLVDSEKPVEKVKENEKAMITKIMFNSGKFQRKFCEAAKKYRF